MKDKSSGLARNTALVAGLTLLSRIAGFVRDLLVARLYGAGMMADAFYVAFRLPNLLRSLVAEGAMTSAFVPVFSSALKDGQPVARKTLAQVSGFLLIVTISLAALGVIYADLLVKLIAPGFVSDPEKYELCVLLTRLMMPYIVFVSFVAMLGGALNTVKIFGTAAAAQLLMNLTLIIAAVIAGFLSAYQGILLLAISVIVGGLVQVLAQIPALSRAGLLSLPSFKIFSKRIGELLLLMLPACIGAAVYQLSIFINTILASLLGEGRVSWLFYADRLIQLPIGIFSIALASVLLPSLAQAATEKDVQSFQSNLVDSLRFTSFIIIPCACICFYFAEPLIGLLFERGAFNYSETLMSALAVQALAIGLWATSCHSMLIRAFIARKDTITPTLVAIFSLLISTALALVLMGSITQDAQHSLLSRYAVQAQNIFAGNLFQFGHVGLGIASSLSSSLAFLVLLYLMRNSLGSLSRRFTLSTFRSCLASALGLSALWLLNFEGHAYWQNLLINLPIFAAVYIFALFLLKSRELEETFRLISRKAKV